MTRPFPTFGKIQNFRGLRSHQAFPTTWPTFTTFLLTTPTITDKKQAIKSNIPTRLFSRPLIYHADSKATSSTSKSTARSRPRSTAHSSESNRITDFPRYLKMIYTSAATATSPQSESRTAMQTSNNDIPGPIDSSQKLQLGRAYLVNTAIPTRTLIL